MFLPEVIKLFSCSTQLSTKFQLLIKTKIPTNKGMSCLSLSDVVFIMLIDVKMLTIMSRINFVLSLVEYVKSFITSGPYFFFQITMCTTHGQCLDMTVAPPPGCVDFTKYTIEKYKAIVKWKTAFYSFYLPVAIAMYMVSI